MHGFNCAAYVPERLFAHLDPDGNGQITIQEFTQGFFERDLSDDVNLDLPPKRRAKRKGTARNKIVSLNAPDTPDDLMKRLKAEICTLDSEKLRRNFRRFRCDVFEKAMQSQSVDLRGLKKALESCGCTNLDRATLKGLFFAIDVKNQGFISFKQLASFVGMVIKSQNPVWGSSSKGALRHTWAHSRKSHRQTNRKQSRKRVPYLSQKELPRLMLVTGQNTERRRPSSSTDRRYAFT